MSCMGINSQNPHIKWTNEMEKDNKLAIFDKLFIRTSTGYSTTIYRKAAASNRYVHFTSSQTWKEKASAIRTLKA